MKTLTIPRNLIKEGFVVLPRREYENLVRVRQGKDMAVKRSNSFKVPKKHKQFYDDLDKELTATMREVSAGKVIGPFDNVQDLFNSLHAKK